MNDALISTVRSGRGIRSWFAVDEVGFWQQARSRAGELGWVLTGKFGLMGANAVLMLLLAHLLEINTYGLLVITISAQLLISRLLMMGVDVGMIRLSGTPALHSRAHELVSAGLAVMLFGTGVLLLLFMVSTPIWLRLGISTWIPSSAICGAVGTALVDYGYSYRLVRREYALAAAAQGGTALWRLGITSIAAGLLAAYPFAVFIAYHGASLVSGLIQTLMICKDKRPALDGLLVRRLLRYSFWQGKANVIVIFSLYQGTFLLMLLKQQAATGIFGLALTLSLGFFAIYNAYGDYLLARIASVKDARGIPQFIKRAFGASFVLILACVPVILLIALLLPRLLRPELGIVVPIFCYLAASMALLILQSPLEAISHYYLKPYLVSSSWIIRALLIGVAGVFLAAKMSALGAAIAQLIGSAVALLVMATVVAIVVRRPAAALVRAD